MSSRLAKTVVFVGTYTEQVESQSKGIYVYELELSSGALTLKREIAGVPNPAYLAFHPNGKYLYAVNEVESFDGEETGGVSAFGLDPTSGDVSLLNSQSSRGKHPCHISVDHTGRFALVANYSSGNAAMLPIQANGSLGPATDVVQHSGSSIHPERQTAPYVHSIRPDPSNRYAIVADLGADKLVVYALDLDHGKLKKHTEVKVQPGAGPRHTVFHPNGKYLYLINELNATLIGFRYQAEAGSLEELQTVPALPEDYMRPNTSAEVRISPNGNHLFASNRGHDSIVCYSVDPTTGWLTYQGHTLTGGREPRNFAIDPTGTFLLAANQKSHNLVTFRIDASSGGLSRTGHEVEISLPVCVTFAHRK
jgi:6-phosphogluconolactonase